METVKVNRPKNRGELLHLISATRNDDGTYAIAPCADCGARTMGVVWHKGSGIAGDVTHLKDGGAIGCVTTMEKLIVKAAADAPPAPVEQPEIIGLIVPPATDIKEPGPYDGVQYIGFRDPVNFGSNGVTFWSHIKSEGSRIVDINSDAIVFAKGGFEYEVPRHNVAYIKCRPQVKQ